MAITDMHPIFSAIHCATVAGSLAITFSNSFGYKLYVQRDQKTLPPRMRQAVEAMLKELSLKLNITKPIALIEDSGMTIAQAQGGTLLPFRAGIVIDPRYILNGSHEQVEFLLSHELIHISSNDALRLALIKTAVQVATYVMMLQFFPATTEQFPVIYIMASLGYFSHAEIISSFVSMMALVAFSKMIEKRADLNAMKICCPATCCSASLFFEGIRLHQLQYRNHGRSCIQRIYRKFMITSTGESRWDIFHPSLKERRDYLMR